MLTTKNADRSKLPPMKLQYAEIKDKYPNDIVMFRVGDFFEAYFEDALPVSTICGLRFTGQRIGNKNDKEEKQSNLYPDKEDKLTTEEVMNSKTIIPLAGVPHRALGGYAQQLIQAGYRVVVVEQLEDPKTVKNRLVKRDVVSILSSMNKEGEYLTEYLNNFICIVYKEQENFSVCFADITTSDVYTTTVSDMNGVLNEISRYKPSEILLNDEMSMLLGNDIENRLKIRIMQTIDNAMFVFENPIQKILSAFEINDISMIKYNSIGELKCLCALINYIEYTQKVSFDFGKLPTCYTSNNFMSIDMYSRMNLELTENISDKTRKGTLLSVLDNCKTSMGSRMLKQWIDKPLQSRAKIVRRLDGVQELYQNEDMLNAIQESMFGILDIGRIMGRLRLNRSIPRDLVNLRDSLAKIPGIKKHLVQLDCPILVDLYNNMGTFEDLCFLLQNSLLEDPVSDIKDGLVLRAGYNKELDIARDMIENSNKYLFELEQSEREKTGIKNLKVVNKNGTCALEVSKAYYDKVPSYYKIEKALKASTRYTTEESEKLQRELYNAIERSKAIEIELYEELKSVVLQDYQNITALCEVLSTLDALCSLAKAAIQNGYKRPDINVNGFIHIKNGRHPVVEKVQGSFVANDTMMDLVNNQFLLITGPNMAGKSTYMRQIALITLMAHIGSFVPADNANICVVDKIFTRIGASDDISSGRSTYMVEMTEVKNILDNATKFSLVLLDEVGRGTSTSDGLSIAQAVSEYIYNNIGCKTLFATHYHELIALEEQLKGLRNYHMSVNKENGSLEFVRKLEVGGLSESYGIDVAELAGLPNSVIERAWEILRVVDGDKKEKLSELKVVDNTNDSVIEKLKGLDKSDLSAVSAYRILCDLIDSVK